MKIGDMVGRKKYGKDILFEIYRIENNIAYLRGVEIRLIADARLDDLEPMELIEITQPDLERSILKRNENMIKGKVLHLDGDSRYLGMCLKKYADLGIKADGYYIRELDVANNIEDLLEKHHPNILVITGHDALMQNSDQRNLDSYTHSRNYIEAIRAARNYEPDKDTLIIFAGGCQSYYEALIAAGANFASSPKRVNIHALDPVYIVGQVASESVKNYVNIEEIIQYTTNKDSGIGGIDTKGVSRKIYPV